jgi:hypothetical protein
MLGGSDINTIPKFCDRVNFAVFYFLKRNQEAVEDIFFRWIVFVFFK